MSSTINALTSGGGLAMAGDTSGQLQLQTNNGTTAVTIDTSQNVGIGTTSPSSYGKLAVVGAAANTLSAVVDTTGYALFRATNTSGQSYVGVDSSTGTLTGTAYATTLWGQNAYPTVFATNNAERMRIDSSGNISINRTNGTNAAKLSLAFSGATNQGLAINDSANNNGSQFVAFYYGTNTFLGSITNVSGTAVAYNTTSDYRLKDNVQPMSGALSVVEKLNPVTYNWKVNGSDGQGFIAHELQAVVPECVTGEKDAVDAEGKPVYQGIDTSFLVATLTAAIQELNAKVEAQAATITALQAKVGV